MVRQEPCATGFITQYYFLSSVVALLCSFTYVAIAVPPDYSYLLAVTLWTFFIYNDVSGLHVFKDILRKSHKSRLIIIFITIAWVTFQLSLTSLFFLFLAAFITFLYFFPVFHLKPLRQYGIWKPLFIGLVFSILTALIPMLQNLYTWQESIYPLLAIWFFVSGLALVFDIGDIDVDENENIGTWPKLVGTIKTKWLIIIMMMTAMLLMFYSAWVYLIEIPESVAFSISCLAGIAGAWKTHAKKSKLYFLFFIDGVMALPFIISLFFSFL